MASGKLLGVGFLSCPQLYLNMNLDTPMRITPCSLMLLSGVFLCVLIYVDDLIITDNDPRAISSFKLYLSHCFHIKDLSILKYFLGIEVTHHTSGLYLNQLKYALDIISEIDLSGAKTASTLIELNHNLAIDKGPFMSDAAQYRQLVGRLIYSTITCPELTYTVHILA